MMYERYLIDLEEYYLYLLDILDLKMRSLSVKKPGISMNQIHE
jgi:hypothetical protein